MKTTIQFLLAALLLPLSAGAQQITFDTQDYKAVSVYDCWEQSPFRTGKLQGNASVSGGIAYLQRSRYGGNLFGLRVDLSQSFRLTKEPRYVHVMINRPVSDSRVMLVTLGKRSERASQSIETEQTWSISNLPVAAGEWCDAVFPIQGFSSPDRNENGIDIHSLVVMPDVCSRHEGTDFVVSIDDIVINDSPQPRTLSSMSQDDALPLQVDHAVVGANQLNGDVLSAQSGEVLHELKVPHGSTLRVKMRPAPGFTYSGMKVRFGYEHRADGSLFDQPRFTEVTYHADDFYEDMVTLPATIFQCEVVYIEGLFVSTTSR